MNRGEGHTGIDPRQVVEVKASCRGDGVTVDGIMREYHFSPSALEEFRETVVGWINQLPDEFLESKGGGWSFLNLCTTKDGALWTGMQSTMEDLVAISKGLGLADYLFPRDVWEVLPGAVPYVVFRTKASPPQPLPEIEVE